jgi:hypothetical protein
MGKPTIALNAGSEPASMQQAPRQLRRVSTDDIKAELLRRDCVDFSKVSLHMRLSFLYLVLALLIGAQLARPSWGLLECFR